MKKHQNQKIILGIFLCVTISAALMAFQDSGKANRQNQKVLIDTLPKNKDADIDINIHMQDLDKVINESMKSVQKSLEAIDWNKMSNEVQQSLKNIDFKKMQSDIDKSINSIDWQKIHNEIDKSLKQIDKEKIKIDIETAMAEVRKNFNSEEFRKSLEEIKNINSDEIKKEMENMKVEMEKLRSELESDKGNMRKELEKAKTEVMKAKSELSNIKEMTNEMEKDGLINKKEGYSIEYKNKEFLINGKKQSQAVTEKYRKYFKGDNFTIKSSGKD